MRYDAASKTVHLDAGASVYALAHERAHEQQHLLGTAAWRRHVRYRRTPILAAWTRFMVELEAATIARDTLRALGMWRWKFAVEMWVGLWSYLRPRWGRD